MGPDLIREYKRVESLPDASLWDKMRAGNALFSFTLEVTARCNNDCLHCYINRPAGDLAAKAAELTFEEIRHIADQAADLGAVWCLVTGGEPLLRHDFEEIYLYLKRKGFLVSVFTNGTLISRKHFDLFRKYPPRDIEMTVYGLSRKTYGQVTRCPGNLKHFEKGLGLLLDAGVPVSLKAVPIRANLDEYSRIADFCRQHTSREYRFDPLIHLRYDRNEARNRDIRGQRLTPGEIARLEKDDPKRHEAMKKQCERLVLQGRGPETESRQPGNSSYLFGCATGVSDFVVGPDGFFRLCGSLCHPACKADLRKITVRAARENLVPQVRGMISNNPAFLDNCARCSLMNLCLWCPAHAWLETGELDQPCKYFCDVAAARGLNL